MLPYLPSDRWLTGDPPDDYIGVRFWVTFQRVRDSWRFVELQTWWGADVRWACQYDQDTIHFRAAAFMRADAPLAFQY